MITIQEIAPDVDWDNEPNGTKLVELGMDSALLMEVCAVLEEATGKSITEDDMYELTVGDVRKALQPSK